MPALTNAIKLLLTHPIVIYLAVISLITFFLFGWDKYKARHNKWRTPEANLLGLCLLGGTIGAALAIWLFHHKCSKRSFMRAFYAIAAFQALALIVISTVAA